MCSASLKSGSELVVLSRWISRTTSSCFGSSPGPRGTTVWEMTGPDLWVPIIFFFSAACAEKLREASEGRIKVAATKVHTLRMLLSKDGEFILLVSCNLQCKIKENRYKSTSLYLANYAHFKRSLN